MLHFRNSFLRQTRLISSTISSRSTNTAVNLTKLFQKHSIQGKPISAYSNRFIFTIIHRPFEGLGEQQLDDEELYWDSLKAGLDSDQPVTIEEAPLLPKKEKKKLFSENNGKSVFVLQLKMQYRSKARQSTTAELQLAESISLINTIQSWRVIDSMIVSTKRSDSAGIFGAGNQEMLAKRISSSGCQALFVVIDRLTNLQVETIRRKMLDGNENIKIYDRYMVVLEIFKRNANSSIAKLQISLAEIPYIRHRFENNELYKTVEKKIRRELDTKLKTRQTLNAQRRDKQIPTISVFGYTNVGKTCFIKAMTGDAKMQPENKLFATLDVTYHGTSLSASTQNVIFIDTIGFISDIPTNLVEAFKTSLQDALHADVVIHLVDISHPDREAQERTVEQILSELAPESKLKDMVKVYNKCDKVENMDEIVQNADPHAFFVSCKLGEGLPEMKQHLERTIYKKLQFIELELVIGQGSEEMAFLYKNAVIKEMYECEGDSQSQTVRVLLNKASALKFISYFPHVQMTRPIKSEK